MDMHGSTSRLTPWLPRRPEWPEPPIEISATASSKTSVKINPSQTLKFSQDVPIIKMEGKESRQKEGVL